MKDLSALNHDQVHLNAGVKAQIVNLRLDSCMLP